VRSAATAVVVVVLLASAAAAETTLRITHVAHAPLAFDPGQEQHVQVRFRLSSPARVVLRVYDARDLEVASISSEGTLAAGDHALVWDGRSSRQLVPAGAYAYTITAQDEGAAVVHDLSDSTGGDAVVVRDLRLDVEARLVRYRLLRSAMVRIRAGMAPPGPVLANVVDWAPRPAGANAEPWAPGEVTRGLAPAPWLQGSALALPANTILVLPQQPRPEWLSAAERPLRPGRRPRPSRQRDPAAQPAERRGDLRVQLEVDEQTAGRRSAAVPIRVDVHPADADRLYAERFGVELYVDGALAFKHELGYLPLTWHWDSTRLPAGPHSITTNVFSYEGNLGVASVTVGLPAQER